MTKKELIKQLENYPDEAEVLLLDDVGYTHSINKIYKDLEYDYLGNIKCVKIVIEPD